MDFSWGLIIIGIFVAMLIWREARGRSRTEDLENWARRAVEAKLEKAEAQANAGSATDSPKKAADGSDKPSA